MADSPPPSSSSTLYNTDVPSSVNYSGHPVDASNVDTQNGPAFPNPTLYSGPRTTKHTLMGIRAAEGHSQRANDPFDYEQKYPEDEEYQEMGPMARIWKVFLDECGKFDTEMVENWRDALDVLLVFAGLFSAVVTTFVSQTCQNLQPDFQEINASKMNEVSELIRAAILNGTEGVLSIPRSTNTAASFKPSLSALWVNGLWFTSLALSLTTALIAVLTKQWIHQYMSVPSGTPRDRSRIRQFRYMSLQQWQVPIIIGLLPVLMHVSLGVFFAGLTVFLCSLNTRIAGIIGAIAASAFGVYITTNLLPLFKPGCPYKTPLTIHSHSLSRYICSQLGFIRLWFGYVIPTQRKENGASVVPSLKTLEMQRVDGSAGDIDVQCLSWLFNASSNSSVQRVIMQAISNLPLQDAGGVRSSIPSLQLFISSTMTSVAARDAEQPTYERLFRAFSRLEPNGVPYPCGGYPTTGHRLSHLAHRSRAVQAAEFLRRQIVAPTVKMDVLSWALIMTSALHEGAAWLDVNVTDSEVWRALVAILIASHRCSQCDNCDRSRKELVTLNVSQPGRELYTLTILDAEGTSEACQFCHAIGTFMWPSFTQLILNEYDSLREFPPDLPPIIALHLNLMVSPSVRAVDIWTEGLWQLIQMYVGVLPAVAGNHTVDRHPEIIMPMFNALLDVVSEDDFVETCTLTLGQKMDACSFLLRTFYLDPNLQEHMRPLLARPVILKIFAIAFSLHPILPSPLVTDMLDFLLSSNSSLAARAYSSLHERRWLEEIEVMLSSWPDTKVPIRRQEIFYDLTYPFLACAYVKGLRRLQTISPAVYNEVLDYMTPSNLLRISKLVLLADAERRKSIWILADIAGSTLWKKCGEELSSFLESKKGRAAYDYHANYRQGYDPFDDRVLLLYGTFADLTDLLYRTMHLQLTSRTKPFHGCEPTPFGSE